MQNTAIMVIPEAQQFALQQRQAIALFKSALFPDLKNEAQAIAKVMAGAEMGLPPFTSIKGIHIIQGKPVVGADIMATLIGTHPEYDYRVVTPAGKDDEFCSITFYRVSKGGKEELGTSTFTLLEAQKAGLMGKDAWKKFTSDMLFARAISRGARRFTPAIFRSGAVYTPDELGADVDEDSVITSKQLRLNAIELQNESESITKLGE